MFHLKEISHLFSFHFVAVALVFRCFSCVPFDVNQFKVVDFIVMLIFGWFHFTINLKNNNFCPISGIHAIAVWLIVNHIERYDLISFRRCLPYEEREEFTIVSCCEWRHWTINTILFLICLIQLIGERKESLEWLEMLPPFFSIHTIQALSYKMQLIKIPPMPDTVQWSQFFLFRSH